MVCFPSGVVTSEARALCSPSPAKRGEGGSLSAKRSVRRVGVLAGRVERIPCLRIQPPPDWPTASHPPHASRRRDKSTAARAALAVIARSETTKQSSFLIGAKMDCFASARNDGTNDFKLESPPASWPGSAKRVSRTVPAIHVLPFHARKDVDARHKAGHDGGPCRHCEE